MIVTYDRIGAKFVYTAWEKSSLINNFPSHTNLRRFDGVWFGSVPSRVPHNIDDEDAWYATNEQEAVTAILKGYPHLLEIGGVVQAGAVEVSINEEPTDDRL